MKQNQLIAFGIFLTVSFISAAATADIVITMTEAGDGGILVSGTGSGIVSATSDVGENDWDFNDFTTNYLNNGDVSSEVQDSISGSMTNVTTSTTVDITGLRIDSDILTTGSDDFTIKTDAISFTVGDAFSLDFSGAYLVSNIPFTDLNVGTHVLVPDDGDDEEIFGIVTLNVVSAIPEPSTMAILGLYCVGLVSRRMRNQGSC